MKEKDKRPDNDSSEEKIHVSGSVFQSAGEMKAEAERCDKEQREEALRKQAELERKRREEHERRLYEEKKELIRLKQGIIEESEIIHEEAEAEVKLSFFKKISNFFYHNKWWLGMGVFCAGVVIWFVVSMVMRPNPDVMVMVIGDNYRLGEESEIQSYFESLAEDYNGNGKIEVAVSYIPYGKNDQQNYANGVDTKLTAEMQSGESVIAVCGPDIPKLMLTDEVFQDLTGMFPDDGNVKGYAYMLSDTEFASRVGLGKSDIPEGWFIAIRTPKKLLYSSREAMQKTYDKDLPLFEAVVRDLASDK